jgi:hypothetical protein
VSNVQYVKKILREIISYCIQEKRKDCTEHERTDPYIVMPLSVFGCDYLYEKRLIYIE